MSLTLTFEIKITSDYHVGSGHGLGTEVDSALLRDVDLAPALRGSSLNGLLRDGLWQLLQLAPLADYRDCQASGLANDRESYCGQYATDELTTDAHVAQCPVCRLFGTPRVMKRWRIGSARPVGYEIVSGTPHERGDFSDQPVMRVRVDPRTRRAAPNKLFSEEQGGARIFCFTATCSAEDQAALDEAALLVAAARAVRQLGRSRRRGQGECEFTLVKVQGAQAAWGDDPQEQLLDHFATRWLEVSTAVALEAGTPLVRTLTVPPNEGEPVRYRIIVRLDEPLIVADRATAGNRFASHLAIPGKALRGALAHRAAQQLDLQDTGSDTYAAFVDLFLRDAVRFPTLYPLLNADKKDPGHYPVIPTPGDGFGCKVYKKHQVQWGTQAGEVEKCPECGNPVKGIRSGFYLLHTNPKVQKPETVTEMHIQVDPQSNRVQEGQLFDYAALAPGQYFAGELHCANATAWEQFKACTGVEEEQAFSLWLGKGTRRGYGKVSVWVEKIAKDTPHFSVYHLLEERVAVGEQEITLTLLSDTIVRDQWGRYFTGFTPEWLNKALGFPVEIADSLAYSSTTVIDGFNDQWRLPRRRVVALTAGSTVRLKVAGGLTQENWKALEKLECEGIGERRNEGYGQVAINHATQIDASQLDGTVQLIPKGLSPVERSTKDSPATFVDTWTKTLIESAAKQHKAWRALKGAPAMALARWLNALQNCDITTIQTTLGHQGLANDVLKGIIREQGIHKGENEYGAREQKDRLEEARELIKDLLNTLRSCDSRDWKPGLRMLADRVADYAGEKGDETGGAQ
jgi:CRISPR-associated protein Csx10